MRKRRRRADRSRGTRGGVGIRKGIFILPILVTSASLFLGFYAIIATLHGDFIRASYAIFIAGFCDLADGRIARATRSVSRFGIEYDSLADLIAFGLAPGVLIFHWGLESFGRWGWSAAFLYVICGALRLARYNVQVDNIESKNFKGLPIPMAAGLIITTILLYGRLGISETSRPFAVLVVIFLLAFLMVSNIKFMSFKDLGLVKRKPFTFLVGLILLLIVVVAEHQIMLFVISVTYILSGPAFALMDVTKRKQLKRDKSPSDPEQEGIVEKPTQ